MSSPGRMEMLAAAIARLVEAMRLMDANQQDREQVLRVHDTRTEEHEARIRESEARLREYEGRAQEYWARIRENQARIREIIAVLTEMQPGIARLDAAS